jgi:hypothetical protein
VAAPPPRNPQRPVLGGPARVEGEDAIQKSRREKDELESETSKIEDELEELKARYDQYFLGIERREPNRARDELRKRVLRVKEAFTRNTGLKFRIQSLHARYLSYERLWLRSAKEKEEGTYHRDVFKARLHAARREELERRAAQKAGAPAAAAPAPTPAPAPARPAAAAATPAPIASATPAPRPAVTPAPAPGAAPRPPAPRAPAPPPAAGAMSAAQLRALYDSYVAAKRSCNEDTSRLTYEAVASTVSKQIPELMNRFKAKTVEFKVEVKDGKAVLKAIPKV